MTDLFNKGGDPSNDAQNVLDQLVGEGKKFKTVEDLAKGKLESDAFIERLTDEQKSLREQLEKLDAAAKEAETLKSVLDKLGHKPNSGSEGKDGNQPNPGPEEIEKLVSKMLQEREVATSRETNRKRANDELLKRFEGDQSKAKEYLDNRAKELGMSTEALGELSETSPQAFATLVGLRKPENFSGANATHMSGRNSDASNFGGEKNASYYKELKQTDRKKFYSVGVQQELIKFGEKHGVDVLREILYG